MQNQNPGSGHVVVSLLLVASVAMAQQQFAELPGRHLPEWRGTVGRLALVDVDGDGDLDLVLPVRGGPNRLWQNDGSGAFIDVTATHMPAGTDEARAVAAADIDGDGDQDLAFAYSGFQGSHRLYRNLGGGVFTDITGSHFAPQGFTSRAVLFVDVDGDGDRDLVFADDATSPLRHRLFRNDGTGLFQDDSATSMPAALPQAYATNLAAADIDGDGDQDLVITGASTRLYTNDGTGVFTDGTAARLPTSTDDEAAAFGDVDGDGDADLVLAGVGQNRLYRNLGNGVFADVTATTMAVDTAIEHAVALRDFDGDGDLDLATANMGPDRFYQNVGGVFVDTMAQRLPWHEDNSLGLAVGDVDGDGDLDLVYGNSLATQCRLVCNDGQAHFADTSHAHVPSNGGNGSRHAVVADIDGDGDADCLVADAGGKGWSYRNDGGGTFTASPLFDLQASGEAVRCLAVADVDGDGDRDLIAGISGSTSMTQGWCRLYRNTGAGTFHDVSAVAMPPTTPWLTGLVTGDFDLDGDLDVVGSAQNERLYLENNGATFVDRTNQKLPPVNGPAATISAGDLDGDGDLDLVVGIPLQASRLWTNQGNGVFVDTTGGLQLAVAEDTTRVLLIDVDGDQDLDLLFACGNGWASGQERLYRNDGGGAFTDVTSTHLPVQNDATPSAAAGDLDGDGDVDLLLGGYVPTYAPPVGQERVLRNDGSGVFTDVTTPWAPPTQATTHALALADFDRDGDLDVLLGTGAGDRAWFNLQRQLDAPFVLRAGRPWTLEAYGRGGAPGTSDLVWPWLSLARVVIAVPPFGVLGIDPVASLPPFVVPQPAGLGSTTWPVPNTPSLAGLALYVQALQLASTGSLHLTNVVHDVLRR